MSLSDPLGDMLTRIRNGQMRGKESVLMPASRFRGNVLDVLQRHFDGLGIYILSTSKGVLSDSEARVESVGGEILCKIF